MKTHSSPPPICNIEAEQAVIGAILLDNSCYSTIREILRPESFARPSHRTIFRAVEALARDGKAFDYLTVMHSVADMMAENRKKPERHQIEVVDVELDYLAEVAEKTPSSANVVQYATAVRECEARRDAMVVAVDLKERAEYDSVAEIAGYLREQADAISAKVQKQHAVPIATVIDQMVAEWRREIEHAQKTGRVGIPTGLGALDAKIGGFEPGKLYVIGARPSHGKTSLAAQMCVHASVAGGSTSLFFTSEMSNLELAERMASAMAQVDLRRVKQGLSSEAEYLRLNEAIAAISAAPIWCDETPQISIEHIVSRTKNAVQRHGCKIIFVDYLQRLSSESIRKTYNREQEVAQIAVTLKSLARRHEIPVVVLAQFSRDVEKDRGGKRYPRLSDLRESGAIEQEADTALLLWYGYKAGWQQEKTQFDIVVAKQRGGGTGQIQLRFVEEFCRFEDVHQDVHRSDNQSYDEPPTLQ